MSITKLSPCQMGPIHCPKFLLPGLGDLCRPASCLAFRLALRLGGNSWFLGSALNLNSLELSLFPHLEWTLPLTLRLLFRNCLSSFYKLLKSFLFGPIAGLRAPLSRFLEGELHK